MSRLYTADWVLPVSSPPIERGGVAVENGRIAAVGPAAELGGTPEHFPGAVIVPGFVNAHSHLEYAVYAGFGDGLPFLSWLRTHVERKRRLLPADALPIARLGASSCLASGVTTVADASFTGAAAQACAELGLRAVVYLEVFGGNPRAALGRFGELVERAEPFRSERVSLGVSPHAPYTTSPAVYEACLELGLPVATHLAESDSERRWLVSGAGPFAELGELLVPPGGETGIRALARRGLLGRALVAAHCVAVDDEEISLLASSATGVAHCPRSNALLGCGVAPLRALLDAGVPVGLGTDSPASTPSFDMFDEMRAAIAHARAATADATALPAASALELATLGSARALGLEAEVGSLAPGKRADLAIVSLEGSPYVPWEDPAAAVVFGGAPHRVCRTIVDGEVRYSRGGSEWHELRRTAAAARDRMLAPGSSA